MFLLCFLVSIHATNIYERRTENTPEFLVSLDNRHAYQLLKLTSYIQVLEWFRHTNQDNIIHNTIIRIQKNFAIKVLLTTKLTHKICQTIQDDDRSRIFTKVIQNIKK